MKNACCRSLFFAGRKGNAALPPLLETLAACCGGPPAWRRGGICGWCRLGARRPQ